MEKRHEIAAGWGWFTARRAWTGRIVAGVSLGVTVALAVAWLLQLEPRGEAPDVADAPSVSASATPTPGGRAAPAAPRAVAAAPVPVRSPTRDADELAAREDLERLREPMLALFAAQEGFGPGAEQRYRERDRQFFADPGASRALRARYRELPPEHGAERWRIVATLGEHLSPENAAFLRDAAVEAAAGRVPQADGMVGPRAALGVAEAWEKGSAGGADLLRDVLEKASPAAVRAVMIRLTENGSLAPWQRQLVADRGLATEYRKLTAAEQASIERLNPGTGPKPPREGGPPGPVPSLEQLGATTPE